MPNLAQGANVTLTLAAYDMVNIDSHNGEYKIEFPAGTTINTTADTRSFGPYPAGGSFKITANSRGLYYEQVSGAPIVGRLVVGVAAPVNADGRVDGTVWVY